jgi:predicted dehydrogenase
MSVPLLQEPPSTFIPSSKTAAPRLGFLGVGWIGRHRLEAIARSGLARIEAIADPTPECLQLASGLAPEAPLFSTLDELLTLNLDGVVVATPSALHAGQSIAALQAGAAVFCQKPLARDAAETGMVIDVAERVNRLLAVDLSYRHLSGVRRIRDLIQQGELGDIFSIELAFHNAYGPDKSWFYKRELSGGGCVIDLGIHLVDLALWMLDFPPVSGVSSRLFSQGRPLRRGSLFVEDYAIARIDLATGPSIQLSCSWNLPAGQDAIIEGKFYGTRGGAAIRNVNGSFYEFTAELFRKTSRTTLSAGPEPWGERAALAWVRRLADSPEFDPSIRPLDTVAEVLDLIYAAGGVA